MISVIIPTYNEAIYLPATLDSVADSNTNKEVIVVSHGGVMMCLWAYAAGSWDDAHAPSNCGMVLIEHGPKGYSLPRVIDDAISVKDAGG